MASTTPSGPQPAPATTHTLEMAHVLFMDIVAYSKLPIDQQQKVLKELQEIVSGTEAVTQAKAEDKLISLPTGDGMALVFFGHPEFPVECALEIGVHCNSVPPSSCAWEFIPARCTAWLTSTLIAMLLAAASTWRSG